MIIVMAESQTLQSNYDENSQILDCVLRVKESFDIVARRIMIADKRASIYFVDGFVKDDIMEKIMEFIMSLKPEDFASLDTAEKVSAKFITYVEVDTSSDTAAITRSVLSGMVGLLIEGYNGVILIDSRTYPARSIEEPDSDHVLRGAHDGFVETLVFNTALIRRRIRDPRLTMEIFTIGSVSQSDVVLCYMEGEADPKLVDKLRRQLKEIRIPTLTMGQESLMECLVKRQWYNPFPKVRYTERPESACAGVVEGQILIITDNTPAVMVLPTAIFDFTQDANDYYFPPLVGGYLRLIRMMIVISTLFLTPIWVAFLQNPDTIPMWLDFIRIQEPNKIPIIVQLLLIEVMIDGLKLASLNTPNSLSSVFGLVGALVLGEFAVTARLFVPEVLLYMAFVAASSFTQPSYELGYAFKLFRMFLLILTAAFSWWGLVGGVIFVFIIIATTRTVGQTSYLAPLIPFNWKALKRLFIRRALHPHNC